MALFQLVYGRVSSLHQSIDLQVAQFEALGYDEVFLEHVSGRRRNRPEFLKLVDRALELRSQGHRVRVCVVEWTRWARDTAYSLEMLQKLESAGVEVIKTSTGQAVTLQTPEGMLQAGMESVMAHYYSVELSAKIRRSYEHRRNQQRAMGGPVPWGYQRNIQEGRFEPGPDWEFCRGVILRYIGGANLTELVRWLWAEHGIKKSSAGLRLWLTNPILRGHLAYNGRSDLRYNCHPALLNEAEYQAVLGRLALNRQLRGKNKGRVYAVPTVVFCARCGERCSTCSNKLTRYFYCYRACKRGDCDASTRYTRQDWIEAAIQEAILEAAEVIAAAALSEDAPDPRIAALEGEAEGLRPFAGRASIAAEIEAIELEIAQLKAAQGNQAAGAAELRQQILALQDMPWEELSQEQRREIYLSVIERVEIESGEVVLVKVRGVG